HVVHADVDLDHVQPGHPLDGRLDVALDVTTQVSDADPVLHHDVEVDGGLGLADLDADALGDVRPGAARNPLPERAEGTSATAAHGVHARHLPAGNARHL